MKSENPSLVKPKMLKFGTQCQKKKSLTLHPHIRLEVKSVFLFLNFLRTQNHNILYLFSRISKRPVLDNQKDTNLT